MRSLALPVVLVLAAGCKAPPDAPDELDELVGYMYGHMPDEDQDAMQAGAANMDTWLFDGIDQTLEGYRVNNLSTEEIDALGEGDRDLDGLVGAAVGHVSDNAPHDLAAAAIGDDPLEMYPDTYDDFTRDVHGDMDCFLAGDCERLETEITSVLNYPLGVQVTTHSMIQYRWIDTDPGPVLVERTWLREPATVNVSWLTVDQQYYLWVVLPDGDGARTLQSTWVVATLTGASVPENAALDMVINSMSGTADKLDAWVDAK
jgi:hypothetical protein